MAFTVSGGIIYEREDMSLVERDEHPENGRMEDPKNFPMIITISRGIYCEWENMAPTEPYGNFGSKKIIHAGAKSYFRPSKECEVKDLKAPYLCCL